VPESKPRKRRKRAPARPAPRTRAQKSSRGLIAVDIGNSEIVAGVFRGARLERFWRLTSGRQTADEVELQLEALLRGVHLGLAPSEFGAVLCSVVPALTLPWEAALERVTGRPPVEVSAATVPALTIRYHDRTVVGADRIANAVAARRLYGTPAIVVDLGTATTFDCISRTGSYVGGIIAPGLGLAAEALFQRAARIPRVELRRPERALGRNTEESLRAGVVWGTAGAVDALVRRLALEMRGTPHVIATGGWSTMLASECETINVVDEGLTLKGMRLIWEGKA
jgi:type III pantothenate kinase